MSAVLTALSLAWHFLLENPGTVFAALSALTGAVFYVRRLLNLRLKPDERDRILAIALPIIAGGKALAEKTKTPWDDLAVKLAERIAGELKDEGLASPGAVSLVSKHLDVENVTAKLVSTALKQGLAPRGK